MRSFSLPSTRVLAVLGTSAATLIAGVGAASAAGLEDSFGQQVKTQVFACMASGPRTGEEGIGGCVSSWVRLHNPATMAREASEARELEPSEASEPRRVEKPDSDATESDADTTKTHTSSRRPQSPPAIRFTGGGHPGTGDHTSDRD